MIVLPRPVTVQECSISVQSGLRTIVIPMRTGLTVQRWDAPEQLPPIKKVPDMNNCQIWYFYGLTNALIHMKFEFLFNYALLLKEFFSTRMKGYGHSHKTIFHFNILELCMGFFKLGKI